LFSPDLRYTSNFSHLTSSPSQVACLFFSSSRLAFYSFLTLLLPPPLSPRFLFFPFVACLRPCLQGRYSLFLLVDSLSHGPRRGLAQLPFFPPAAVRAALHCWGPPPLVRLRPPSSPLFYTSPRKARPLRAPLTRPSTFLRAFHMRLLVFLSPYIYFMEEFSHPCIPPLVFSFFIAFSLVSFVFPSLPPRIQFFRDRQQSQQLPIGSC